VGTIAGAGTRYGMEGGWGLSSPEPKPDTYSMNAGFDTQPNNFGLDDSSGGFYDFTGGF
jgi:hypothetical protein